ncbi:hypothetical protein [Okeania sp. SIO3B5]|nr:hypothetical protein [Okeania sp. SIO3B5]
MIVVSDTSPLNGLVIVGHLPLLQQIYRFWHRLFQLSVISYQFF